MRTPRGRAIVLAAVVALAMSACGGDNGGTAEPTGGTGGGSSQPSSPSATDTGTMTGGGGGEVDLSAAADALRNISFPQTADAVDQAEALDGAPQTATLADGSTFQLADRIAQKLENGDPINYVFSYQSTGIALFSDQYKTGYDKTLPVASDTIYPLEGKAIAPPGDIDIPQQISQIEALLNTDQIDCLTIEPPDSNAFTDITNRAMSEGIPVFTVGVTSNGNEFTNFTQVPNQEGHTAAKTVLDWMDATGNDLKVFTVSGGDPSAFWAQGRMKGFEEGIKEAIPDAEFINTAENPLSVTYDPAQTYDAYKSLLAGHPELDFILNVDIGAEHADRAIDDAGRTGEVFTAGWNVSLGQLDGIEAGQQIAAFDQRWSEQAGFGAPACATFLATGKVLPNTQHLAPVTADNVAEARADLEATLG